MIWIFLPLIIGIGAAGCSKKAHSKRMPAAGPPMEEEQPNMPTNAINAERSTFFAVLSGKNIAPDSVQTEAGGTVYLEFNKDSSQIYYTVNLSKAADVTDVRLYYGVSGKRGAAVVWLYPCPDERKPFLIKGPVNGTLKSAMINQRNLTGAFRHKTMKDLILAILHDSIYAQVNTKAHPKGELRGRLQKKGL